MNAMNSTKSAKVSMFGFSTVNAGQRNVSSEPELIVTTTEGGFRVTGPVTKALNIAAGEYIQFVNNISNIDDAIRTKNEHILALCEANGLDLDDPQTIVAIHREFDAWGIVKGVRACDSHGIPLTAPESISQAAKLRFALANYDEMLAGALASDEVEADVKNELTREGATKEEIAKVLTKFVTPREVAKYIGSKTSNSADMAGTGTVQTFTDSNIWAQLKSDLSKEDSVKKNRVFSINLDDITTTIVNNGFENIEVPMLILGDFTDKDPIVRKKKGAELVEE